MPDNKARDVIEKISQQHKKAAEKNKEGLWGLLKSIHSFPILREWLTLESVPLIPYLKPSVSYDGTTHEDKTLDHDLFVLITTPSKDKKDMLSTPWALVWLRLPTRQLRAVVDLRELGEWPPVELLRSFVPSKDWCMEAESKLTAGDEIISLPPELSTLYDHVLGKLPGLLERSHHHTVQIKQPDVKFVEKDLREDKQESIKQPEETPSKKSLTATISRLPELLARTGSLIEESDLHTLRGECRRIYNRMKAPHFSVVFAGEFSRGKSTLINELLGDDILPVGDIPTTSIVTKIVHGNERRLRIIGTDGHREAFSLHEEGWDSIAQSAEEQSGTSISVVTLDSQWLKDTGVQVVDTPGAGDLVSERAVLVTDTIASADATLVAIAATMPLSLTERSFIEQNVLSKEIPRVAVVITRLDEVNENQRGSVITHICDAVRRFAPKNQIWCKHDDIPDETRRQLDVVGRKAMLERLGKWALDSKHVEAVARQVSSQLYQLVSDVRSALAKQLAEIQNYSAQQHEKKREDIQKLSRNQTIWEDLRIQFEKREMTAARWLENALRSEQGKITEALSFEFAKSPNPKGWVEKELPYHLRREMNSLSRCLEGDLQEKIAADAAWLEKTVRKAFAVPFDRGDTTPLVNKIEGSALRLPEDLEDLGKFQLKSRISLVAATVAIGILTAPTGFAPVFIATMGLGGSLVRSKTINSKRETQQEEVLKHMKRAIEKMMDSVCEKTIERLESAYISLLKSTVSSEKRWKNTVMENINNRYSEGDAGAKNLLRWISQAEAIMKEIGGISEDINDK